MASVKSTSFPTPPNGPDSDRKDQSSSVKTRFDTLADNETLKKQGIGDTSTAEVFRDAAKHVRFTDEKPKFPKGTPLPPTTTTNSFGYTSTAIPTNVSGGLSKEKLWGFKGYKAVKTFVKDAGRLAGSISRTLPSWIGAVVTVNTHKALGDQINLKRVDKQYDKLKQTEEKIYINPRIVENLEDGKRVRRFVYSRVIDLSNMSPTERAKTIAKFVPDKILTYNHKGEAKPLLNQHLTPDTTKHDLHANGLEGTVNQRLVNSHSDPTYKPVVGIGELIEDGKEPMRAIHSVLPQTQLDQCISPNGDMRLEDLANEQSAYLATKRRSSAYGWGRAKSWITNPLNIGKISLHRNGRKVDLGEHNYGRDGQLYGNFGSGIASFMTAWDAFGVTSTTTDFDTLTGPVSITTETGGLSDTGTTIRDTGGIAAGFHAAYNAAQQKAANPKAQGETIRSMNDGNVMAATYKDLVSLNPTMRLVAGGATLVGFAGIGVTIAGILSGAAPAVVAGRVALGSASTAHGLAHIMVKQGATFRALKADHKGRDEHRQKMYGAHRAVMEWFNDKANFVDGAPPETLTPQAVQTLSHQFSEAAVTEALCFDSLARKISNPQFLNTSEGAALSVMLDDYIDIMQEYHQSSGKKKFYKFFARRGNKNRSDALNKAISESGGWGKLDPATLLKKVMQISLPEIQTIAQTPCRKTTFGEDNYLRDNPASGVIDQGWIRSITRFARDYIGPSRSISPYQRSQYKSALLGSMMQHVDMHFGINLALSARNLQPEAAPISVSQHYSNNRLYQKINDVDSPFRNRLLRWLSPFRREYKTLAYNKLVDHLKECGLVSKDYNRVPSRQAKREALKIADRITKEIKVYRQYVSPDFNKEIAQRLEEFRFIYIHEDVIDKSVDSIGRIKKRRTAADFEHNGSQESDVTKLYVGRVIKKEFKDFDVSKKTDDELVDDVIESTESHQLSDTDIDTLIFNLAQYSEVKNLKPTDDKFAIYKQFVRDKGNSEAALKELNHLMVFNEKAEISKTDAASVRLTHIKLNDVVGGKDPALAAAIADQINRLVQVPGLSPKNFADGMLNTVVDAIVESAPKDDRGRALCNRDKIRNAIQLDKHAQQTLHLLCQDLILEDKPITEQVSAVVAAMVSAKHNSDLLFTSPVDQNDIQPLTQSVRIHIQPDYLRHIGYLANQRLSGLEVNKAFKDTIENVLMAKKAVATSASDGQKFVQKKLDGSEKGIKKWDKSCNELLKLVAKKHHEFGPILPLAERKVLDEAIDDLAKRHPYYMTNSAFIPVAEALDRQDFLDNGGALKATSGLEDSELKVDIDTPFVKFSEQYVGGIPQSIDNDSQSSSADVVDENASVTGNEQTGKLTTIVAHSTGHQAGVLKADEIRISDSSPSTAGSSNDSPISVSEVSDIDKLRSDFAEREEKYTLAFERLELHIKTWSDTKNEEETKSWKNTAKILKDDLTRHISSLQKLVKQSQSVITELDDGTKRHLEWAIQVIQEGSDLLNLPSLHTPRPAEVTVPSDVRIKKLDKTLLAFDRNAMRDEWTTVKKLIRGLEKYQASGKDMTAKSVNRHLDRLATAVQQFINTSEHAASLLDEAKLVGGAHVLSKKAAKRLEWIADSDGSDVIRSAQELIKQPRTLEANASKLDDKAPKTAKPKASTSGDIPNPKQAPTSDTPISETKVNSTFASVTTDQPKPVKLSANKVAHQIARSLLGPGENDAAKIKYALSQMKKHDPDAYKAWKELNRAEKKVLLGREINDASKTWVEPVKQDRNKAIPIAVTKTRGM